MLSPAGLHATDGPGPEPRAPMDRDQACFRRAERTTALATNKDATAAEVAMGSGTAEAESKCAWIRVALSAVP